MMSRYSYSDNRPLSLVDPSGLAGAPTHCAGKPSGIVYIQPRRGHFDNLMLTGQIAHRNAYSMGAWAHLSWTPYSDTSFTSAATNCCCCDEIGFVQIAKSTVRSNSPITDWIFSTDWFVDVETHGTFRYQHQTSSRPCPPRTNRGRTWMDDFPYINIYPHLSTVVYSMWQEFEACVVCLSGLEGPAQGIDVVNPAPMTKLDGLTVYGCVEWSYRKVFGSISDVQTLTMDGRANTWNVQSDRIDMSYDGAAPSAEFSRTVLGHSLTP